MKPRGHIRPEPSKIMSESETPDLPPDLSVVLTVVDSGAVLERCLESLANHTGFFCCFLYLFVFLIKVVGQD